MKYRFVFKERMSAAYARLWSKQYEGVSKRIHGDFGFSLVVDNGLVSAFLSQRAIQDSARFSETFLNRGFRKKFLAESKRQRRAFDRFYREFLKTDLSNATDLQLAAWLEEFESLFIPITVSFNQSQEEFTQKPYLFLREKLLEKGLGADADLGVLLAPNRADKLVQEERDLMKLSMKEYTRKDLMRHSIAYSLLFYNSYDVKSNLDFLEKRIREMKKTIRKKRQAHLKQLNQKIKQQGQNQNRLYRKIKDPQLVEVAQLLRDLGYDRLELKNTWAGAEYRFLDLFKEVSRRLGAAFRPMMAYATLDDMKTGLKSKRFSMQTIQSQRRFCAYHAQSGRVDQVLGPKAEEFVKKVLPQYFEKKTADRLDGFTANPGRVSGKAHVIVNAGIEELLADEKNFQTGSILVTAMTQPNMMLLAKVAAGIVTDEGGITSHAAVISRELGIPCIVGTRDATRAIQTGDFLELDATASAGRVKICRKST